MAATYSTAEYPYESVCYIVVTYPNGESFQGSGVIIGPHTVLTASHLLWDADNDASAVGVAVYPGFDMGGAAISGQWTEHFNAIADAGDKETEAASQNDFAVIDFAADLASYGAFAVAPDFQGGEIHMTGYPASADGAQVDQTGAVTASPQYDTLDYATVFPSPGYSGGPLWVADHGSQAAVVGLVSTSDWAVRLTSADLATIDGWETSDSYLWTGAATELAAGQTLPFVNGGSGNDTLTGWSGGDDTLFGASGADSIMGGADFNRVNGNEGADTIVGRSTVGDWLLGGQGDDSIDASASSANNLVNGNRGDDTLTGGAGRDTLRGGQGDDVIHAGPGGGWISGDMGANTIYGGQGADTFHAGAGHDYVVGWHDGDHVLVDAGVGWQVSQVSNGVRIAFANGGEMDLLGAQKASLQAGWIVTA